MKKVSLRNLSLLGLVLMGASAVTAAILPKKSANVLKTGRLVAGSISIGGTPQLTCDLAAQNRDCDYTATNGVGSTTSADGEQSSADVAGSTGAGVTHNTGTNLVNGTFVSAES
jgi:hypothetical protein